MVGARSNHLPDLAQYVIRPALVEAHLITDKRARDAVYAATLGEELCAIEDRLASLERELQLNSAECSELCHPTAPPDHPDANWIRAKSNELEARLRRIEQSFHREGGTKIGKSEKKKSA